MAILDVKNVKFSKLFPGKIYWEDEKLVYPFRFRAIKGKSKGITRANITDSCENNYPLSSYFDVFYKLLRIKINTLLDKKDIPVYNLFDNSMNPWALIPEDENWFSASYCQYNNIANNKNKDKLNIVDTKDLHYFFDLIKENINIMIGSGESRIEFDPSKIWADKSIEIMAEDKSGLILYENNTFKNLRISCFRNNWLMPLKINAKIIVNNLEINNCQLYDSELLFNYRKSHMSIIDSEVRNSKIEKESLILDNIIFGENSKFSCYKQLLLRINEKNKFKNCEFHCHHGYNEIYNSRHNNINIDKVSSQEGLSIYCEENSTIHIKECWCINEDQFIIGINKNTNLIIDNLYVPDKSVLINVCESEAIFGINVPINKVGVVKIGKRNDDLINNIKVNHLWTKDSKASK